MRAVELFEEYDPDPLFNNQDDMSNEQLAPMVAEFALQHCRPYVNQIDPSRDTLYRGVKRYEERTFIKEPRQDRRPKDSTAYKHEGFNTVIEAIGGVGAANRSNSIFATSNVYDADSYGKVFVIMPIGNFRYTWSPDATDWALDFTLMRFLTDEAMERVMQFGYDKIGTAEHIDFYTDISNYNLKALKNAIRIDTGLEEAIDQKRELMIKADSILYIDYLFFTHYVSPFLAG